MEWTPSKIRSERIARGWSQRDLTEALKRSAPGFKVSLRSVTAWESGEATPSEKNVAALERVFTDAAAHAANDTEAEAISLREATHLQLIAEQARRYADLEAEIHTLRTQLQALRAGNHPQSGRHGALPDHLQPTQSGKRFNSDGSG